jgi:hypothetical protein
LNKSLPGPSLIIKREEKTFAAAQGLKMKMPCAIRRWQTKSKEGVMDLSKTLKITFTSGCVALLAVTANAQTGIIGAGPQQQSDTYNTLSQGAVTPSNTKAVTQQPSISERPIANPTQKSKLRQNTPLTTKSDAKTEEADKAEGR